MNSETIELLSRLGVGALLGASVTAAFTFFTSWLNRRHEIRKERFKRKQELFEKIAQEFEQVHAVIMELFSNYGTYLESEEKTAGYADYSFKKAQNIVIEKIYPALNQLHSIEGRLWLSEGELLATLFTKYRSSVVDLQNQIGRGPKDGLGLQKWNDMFWVSHQIRKGIYDKMREKYNEA